MDEKHTQVLLENDKTIVELRALLASYEKRLARSTRDIPASHAAAAHAPEPLFLVNGTAIDLRASAFENASVIEAHTILDCSKPEEPEQFSFVHKVRSGVFRVHPRKGRATAAVLGPFAGPPPVGLLSTAQTTHPAAPTVRFHISIWIGAIDYTTVNEQVGALTQGPRLLTVPPWHQGFLVSTTSAHSRSGPPEVDLSAAAVDVPWGLLLATIADPAEEISFAWAEFSNIALIFLPEHASEVHLLS